MENTAHDWAVKKGRDVLAAMIEAEICKRSGESDGPVLITQADREFSLPLDASSVRQNMWTAYFKMHGSKHC
jgi:hypothetical protein